MELIIKKYSEIAIAIIAILICISILVPLTMRVSGIFDGKISQMESRQDEEWILYDSIDDEI